MTTQEKSILAQLTRGKTYPLLQKLAEEMFAQWSREVPTGSTEFEYLKSSLSRDYQRQGINLFFMELERTNNSV